MAGSETNRLDPDRLVRLGRVSEVALSPCNTWLAVAVSRLDDEQSRYVSELWRVSVTDPTLPPVRLTRGAHDDSQPRFRPDGGLGFLSDRPIRSDGKSDTTWKQVWLFPPEGGEPRPLTDEPTGVKAFRFARQTGRLFVLTEVSPGIPHDEQRAHAEDRGKRGPSGLLYTEMPVRYWDYWLPHAAPHLIAYRDGDGGTPRVDLTPDADREHREVLFGTAWDVSGDGRRAVITTGRPGAARIVDTALRLIDADTGDHRDLGAVPGVDHGDPRFSPDGRSIACVQTVRERGRADRQRLWLHDVAGADAGDPGSALAPDWDAWPQLDAWSADGTTLLCTAPDRGDRPAFAVDVASGRVTRLTSGRAGGAHTCLSITSDGATVVGIRSRIIHPPEPFAMPARGDAEPTLLANLSGFSEAEGQAIARVESLVTPGDDGVEVQSFLVLPAGGGPHPMLLWVHGGPVSQWADSWHWRWNALVGASAGYAVLRPNPRGSTGRGQAFVDGIWNNEWGGACYRDLMAVTDAACRRADIDERRVAAMGGSFGGYMANWIAVNTDRFRCLMTHAGIYDLRAFSGATDHPSYFHHEMATSPYEDPERFERHSPHRLLERWKTPTLIIHGERDYRVPIGEALHLFDALCWRGVDARLLVFPDENHWIQRPQNILLWYRTVIDFAHEHLEQG